MRAALASPSVPGMSKRHHAVVIGGSMAGLLAARVLADHFEQVTIVERDQFPSNGPAHRRGVPQSPHLHILLMRGQAICEQLFPGLRDELIAAGAPQVDSAQDLLWRNPFGWTVRYRSGMTKLAFTRDLLDWHVRQRLLRHRNVRIRESTDTVGLLHSDQARAVSGIRLRDSAVEADLVVDATGRGSRLPQWLQEMDCGSVEERTVDAHPGYASRLYQPSPGFAADWRAVYMQAAPPHQPRIGVIFPVEGGRWLVTLAGSRGHQPPSDEAGFLAFARSLPSPLIFDAIRTAEPLSDILTTRAGANRLRRYDRCARWPEGLIAVGDAVCAFNPVYGQGMTVAALEAQSLQHLLSQPGHFRARRFQRQVADIVALPWAMATAEDSRYPDADGALLDVKTRLMHRYMDRVLWLATRSVEVRRTLLEVQHMLKPPEVLFAPRISGRVLLRAVS
jgi:2-polyprenyl-6-methoxyphenol hydroxylase-like FAD-dependent oxidoreductase